MNNKHVFVVAELGINHNGSKDILCQLIDGAIEAKADAIKLQKRTVDKVYTKEFLDSYRISPWGTTQYAQKMGLELTKSDYDFIDEYCRGKILWSCSCWDYDSQLFLRQYDVVFNKIASSMLNNILLLNLVAEEGKYTYISTGMSDWEQIDQAVEIFRKHNCPFSLLHTVSCYPMENHLANLLMINTLKERYGCSVGYSCHSKGRIVPLVAVGMGIDCLEKHVTLDKTMYGSDQAASLEMDDFKRLVTDVRGIEKALGNGERILSDAELEVRKKLRGN
jgi:N-acetylneuraminate synthase